MHQYLLSHIETRNPGHVKSTDIWYVCSFCLGNMLFAPSLCIRMDGWQWRICYTSHTQRVILCVKNEVFRVYIHLHFLHPDCGAFNNSFCYTSFYSVTNSLRCSVASPYHYDYMRYHTLYIINVWFLQTLLLSYWATKLLQANHHVAAK